MLNSFMKLFKKKLKISVVLVLLFCNTKELWATSKYIPRFYFAWGYNKEWYTKSDIHIKQASLSNNFAFVKVKGVDKPGWNTGILNKELTIPQYNYRLGYKINSKWWVEINFDHTKYQVQHQTLHMKGIYLGREIDSTFERTPKNLQYQLNNGANFFLFNAVRKVQLLGTDSSQTALNLLLKGGIGFVYPHVENNILGYKNTPHFQFGGFDAGLETALQFVLFKHFFLEYSQKVVYARYSNLKIYEGTARQNFACYEMTLSAGLQF